MLRDHPIDRRTALRLGVTALAASAGYACSPPFPLPREETRRTAPHLEPPDVSPDRVIRTVAGLRPYRASGYRVEAESLGDVLLIHNYGHGGAGVTLSWGTALDAVDLALAQPHRRAAVIGCGAVGLATALVLQEHGFTVRILARDLPPNTTSNVAGALWAPYGVADFDQRESTFATVSLARAARRSHARFRALIGERYAVRPLPLYLLSDSAGAGIPWPMRLTPEIYDARQLSPDEHPFGFDGAWRLETMMIDPDPYLRSLMADFQQRGGTMRVHSFASAGELLDLGEPVVVNCTGMGARDLVGDEELVPVRGQLAFLPPQPEIDYMYIAGGSYMFPRRDSILIGGSSEQGEWSTEPQAETIARIVRGNRSVADRMNGGAPG
jgi:D-amino-acid oxidase